jgi:predicted secreted protein
MSITAALVLFSVTWFLVLFCVLAIRMKSQDDMGARVHGTPGSAPDQFDLGRKLKITSLVSMGLFVVLYLVINSGVITIDNMDIFGIMKGVPPAGG